MSNSSLYNGIGGRMFQSERLCYARADENNEAYVEFLKQLKDDPSIHSQVTDTLLRPQGKLDAESLAIRFSKSQLGVVICLKPVEGGKTDESAAAGAKPTIIGQMCIGSGGISSDVMHNRTASLGITIHPDYQAKGYGREAIDWGLDWAFRHGNLHSVSLIVASFNENAIRLYEKMGFTLDGRLRQNTWFNRAWHDELCFSMIEDEWEVLRGIKKA